MVRETRWSLFPSRPVCFFWPLGRATLHGVLCFFTFRRRYITWYAAWQQTITTRSNCFLVWVFYCTLSALSALSTTLDGKKCSFTLVWSEHGLRLNSRHPNSRVDALITKPPTVGLIALSFSSYVAQHIMKHSTQYRQMQVIITYYRTLNMQYSESLEIEEHFIVMKSFRVSRVLLYRLIFGYITE